LFYIAPAISLFFGTFALTFAMERIIKMAVKERTEHEDMFIKTKLLI